MRALAPHLLSLVLPALTLAFLALPAAGRPLPLLWLAALVGIAIADERMNAKVRSPAAVRPHEPGSALARLADIVAIVQLVVIAALVWRLRTGTLRVLELLAAFVLVGVGSAFSSLVVAHELIHRRPGVMRSIGRVLLWTALHDHFFTEHLRGHHRTVGTTADVLTARVDETFGHYLWRSSRDELASAWRIERRRHAHRTGLRGLLVNEVVRGVVVQLALVLGIAVLAGPVGVAVFLAQAALAHVLVSAVNFFEHWGLVREDGDGAPAALAWDSTAPLSRFALFSLSFHADHHAHAARSFDRLELRSDAPLLPHGYFAMAALVVFRGERARALLREQLVHWQTS